MLFCQKLYSGKISFQRLKAYVHFECLYTWNGYSVLPSRRWNLTYVKQFWGPGRSVPGRQSHGRCARHDIHFNSNIGNQTSNFSNAYVNSWDRSKPGIYFLFLWIFPRFLFDGFLMVDPITDHIFSSRGWSFRCECHVPCQDYRKASLNVGFRLSWPEFTKVPKRWSPGLNI